MRCATSSPSSKRSPRLQSARRPPADTSGSGVAASVHCGGTEQIRPSAKRSSQRLPARLPRFAMHTPPCPEYGWKGWVTVTRCGEAGEIPAFLTEVQMAGGRQVCLAAHKRRHYAGDGGAVGDADRGAWRVGSYRPKSCQKTPDNGVKLAILLEFIGTIC